MVHKFPKKYLIPSGVHNESFSVRVYDVRLKMTARQILRICIRDTYIFWRFKVSAAKQDALARLRLDNKYFQRKNSGRD